MLLRPDCAGARFLERPALVWLGDVSYSFYCYAMSVLLIMSWALLRIVPASIATQRIAETRTIPVAPRSLVAIEAGTILKSAHATMSNTDIA